MRNQVFANGEYYHVYNRGVDKRRIFLKGNDYQRFLNGLIIFNDKKRIGVRFTEAEPQGNEKLVRIFAYCLMPNHFHLLLQQVVDNGISKFLHKLQTGYTMYFNKKYQRSGVLLQGPFCDKRVKDDSYLLHLSRYIHLNPIETFTASTSDKTELHRLLIGYQWSSYEQYVNDESSLYKIIERPKIILDQIGSVKRYCAFVLDGLEIRKMKNIEAQPPFLRLSLRNGLRVYQEIEKYSEKL